MPCWRGLEYADCISKTAFDGEAPFLKTWGVWSTPSLPLLPSPLWHRVVVPVGVPSIGQIDLFKNQSYLIGPYTNKNNNNKKNL